MTERYPDDATLLALEADPVTGVEYIPTGQSPYYLSFRKMLYRLLLAGARANDLRVYADGDLTVGVRPGQCLIHNSPLTFAGAEQIAVPNNTTTTLWLDDAGAVQSGAALPADRTAFVPLATITTDSGAITAIDDLRSQAYLAIADLGQLGLTASADEINQALDAIAATVTAAALNTLTAGSLSTADNLHRHETFNADVAGEATYRIANASGDSSATAALSFDLPSRLPSDTVLLVDPVSGFLRQRFLGVSYALVGTVHSQYAHPGDLTASQTGRLIGAVPVAGQVRDVILCLGENIESDQSADGVTATVKVNGTAVCTVDPAVTDAAGSGFRCTDQGDGTAATVKSDGTEQVSRGDLLTVDLARTVTGNVTNEPADVVVLVVIGVDTPE